MLFMLRELTDMLGHWLQTAAGALSRGIQQALKLACSEWPSPSSSAHLAATKDNRVS